MVIKINPYFVGKTHITKTHVLQVIQGDITVVNILDGVKVSSTYRKGEYIYMSNPIPHFIINLTNKIVILKLIWTAKIGKYINARQLQTEIIFFTGFSSNKGLYQNLLSYFNKHINFNFDSFLNPKVQSSVKITVCDWTKEVYQKGIQKYLDRITKACLSPKVILIGHSWGCQMAARFASKNLKKVKKIFLLDHHPIKKPINKIKSKKDLIQGFFPKCSLQDLSKEISQVSRSINTKYISVSSNLIENKNLANQLKNIPSTLIYATGIKIENNNIEHYCVTQKNKEKLIKMNTSTFQKVVKKLEYITIYRGSHFWFMNNKFENYMLKMWKSICQALIQ